MTSPTEEVGARLKLRDRAQFQRDAQGSAKDIRNIGDAADKAESSGKRMGSGMGIASKGIGGLKTAAGLGAVAVGTLAVGLGALGVKTVGLAMDAAETQSKFSTVFAGMEADVGSFVTQMNAEFGIPTKELQDAASSFGIFAKAAGIPKENLAGFSKDLTGAGMDLASFYNVEPGEAFQALSSGLSGEAEPLRKFGIFLSDASMKAEAASMGLTGEMTEQQKVMVRQKIIMKSLGDAEGDLARTSGGLSNQYKALKGRLTEAGTAIGTALLPYANQLVVALNDRLQPAVKWLQDNLPSMVDDAADSLGYLVSRFEAGGIDAVVTSLDNMTGSGGKLTAGFEEAKSIVDDVSAVLSGVLLPAIDRVSSAIDPAWLSPLGLARVALGFVADNAAIFADVLTVLVVGLTLAKTASMLLAAKVMLVNAALMLTPLGWIVAGLALLVVGLVLAWRHSETFRNVVTGALRAVGKFLINMVDAGLAALEALFGFAAKIPGPIGDAARAVQGSIRSARDGLDGLSSKLDQFGRKKPSPSVVLGGVGVFEENLLRLERRITNIGGVQVRIPLPAKPRAGQGVVSGNIPEMHQGGTTTRGGAAIIQPGEELVVLPPAASVVPLDNAPAVSAATGGGRSGPITLQVVLDRRVLAEAVYDHTGDKVARR